MLKKLTPQLAIIFEIHNFVLFRDYLQDFIRHAFGHVRHEKFCHIFQKIKKLANLF